jgi:hypothetical protein
MYGAGTAEEVMPGTNTAMSIRGAGQLALTDDQLTSDQFIFLCVWPVFLNSICYKSLNGSVTSLNSGGLFGYVYSC